MSGERQIEMQVEVEVKGIEREKGRADKTEPEREGHVYGPI